MIGEIGVLNVGCGPRREDLRMGEVAIFSRVDREGPTDLKVRRAPQKNIEGELFGRLLAVEHLGFSESAWASYWRCLCNCGRVVDVNQKSLTRTTNPTRSCGCLAAERASARSWRGCGELSRHYWNHIKHHADERGIAFEISIEDAWAIYVDQKGRCALSGIEINMGRYRPPTRALGRCPRLGTASLDRKDSAGPYIRSNVQWVHKEINRMKGALGDEQFVAFCIMIADHWRRSNQHPAWRPEAGL